MFKIKDFGAGMGSRMAGQRDLIEVVGDILTKFLEYAGWI